MPLNQQPQHIMQHINAIMPHFCDKCGTKYNPTDIEIVGNNSNRVTCKINCNNCGNNYMMQVNSPSEGVLAAKRAEFKSEMTTKEIGKFSAADKINADEIIDLHDQIKALKTVSDIERLIS